MGLTPEERRDAVLAEIDALPSVKGYGASRRGGDSYEVDLLPGALGAVQEAARLRRMTTASYLRRAGLAMAAFDLEIDVRELLERDPRVTRPQGTGVRDPDGSRFGPWRITGVERST